MINCTDIFSPSFDSFAKYLFKESNFIILITLHGVRRYYFRKVNRYIQISENVLKGGAVNKCKTIKTFVS